MGPGVLTAKENLFSECKPTKNLFGVLLKQKKEFSEPEKARNQKNVV